jgi:diamine N-acetyltransferase
MFNISVGTEQDIPAIINIAEKTWWPTYSPILPEEQIRFMLDAIYAPEHIREQMQQGAQTYLLLSEKEGPLGFASFGKRPDDAAVYKLYKLYVLPSTHKKGYGQALIREIVLRVLKQNAHVLDVNVNRHNPARSFYEKFGFKLLREEDIPVGPYWMNDFVLRLTF